MGSWEELGLCQASSLCVGILWVHEVSKHLGEARVRLSLYSLFSRSKCNTVWS